MSAVLPAANPRRRSAAAIAAVVGLLLALRIAAAWWISVNSDEPQHLHIVWAWTQNLLPYRDVFDNHMPLYQWLSVPPFAWLGERADIVTAMRLAQLPFECITLVLTYRLGTRVWTPRVGSFAVLLISTWPAALAASTEYRPDVPWAMLWLVAVTALCSLPAPQRLRVAAFALGTALVVSLKTSVLLASGALALLPLLLAAYRRGARTTWPSQRELVVLLALSVMPLALVATSLWLLGVGDSAWYCLVQHNLVAGLAHTEEAWHAAALPLLLAAALALAWWRTPRTLDAHTSARHFVLLWPAVYLTLLYGYWPLVPKQDWLPVWPLLALALAGGIESAWGQRRHGAVLVTASFAVLICASSAWLVRDLLTPDEGRTAARLARVLRLTHPGEYVMDAKGDSIFRPRPFYFALETITRYRLHDGSIADRITDAMIATRTTVAIDTKLPAADAQFVAENYLAAGDGVAVLGRQLGELEFGAQRELVLPIAARYAALCRRGAPPLVDGRALDPARVLDAGPHRLIATEAGDCLLVWAAALERDPTLAHDLLASADRTTPHE